MLKREFLRKGEQTKAVPREGLHLKVYDIISFTSFHPGHTSQNTPQLISFTSSLVWFFFFRLKSMYEEDDKLFQLFFGIFFHK